MQDVGEGSSLCSLHSGGAAGFADLGVGSLRSLLTSQRKPLPPPGARSFLGTVFGGERTGLRDLTLKQIEQNACGCFPQLVSTATRM